MSSQLPQQRLTVPGDVNENEFYTTGEEDKETLVTHADLEQAVPNDEKPHLRELDRYWVNKPYAFVVIYENVRENEYRYFAVEPRLSSLERELFNFFKDKLRTTLNYKSVKVDATPAERAITVRNEAISLMKRYNLVEISEEAEIIPKESLSGKVKNRFVNFLQNKAQQYGMDKSVEEEAPVPRNPDTGDAQSLNGIQVRRIVYYLVRDFIRFGRIDPIKNDVNIEDISCNGYDSPVFVFHSEYGSQIVTNVKYEREDLDKFVKRLAQLAGRGISRRQPNIDITLPDGSRAQLTLGNEISDDGTNFTIRQFNEIPFTPVDLLNWKTFGINQMAYMWLAIENGKNIIFSGGTASGKTTSLNAMSLFMPSDSKIVSIEDTREIEIPQSNWIPNMTREAFREGDANEIDEFELLEDALRKRPDYVIVGEVRGEEGRTLFQIMNTGHVTYTTFHAKEPKEVIRRFTTEPINASPSMFDAVDIISVQAEVNMDGSKVRRSQKITEVDEYHATANEFSLNDVFIWEREDDTFRRKGRSKILEEIKEEKGWSDKDLRREWNRRRMVLAYLIDRGINTYAGVATTLQAYMSSKDTVLGLIANNQLESRIAALHKMKTVEIETDPEKEALIPRPKTPPEIQSQATEVLKETEPLLIGHDTQEVDFASTVKDILSEDELPEGDEELLDQLGSVSEETDALPNSLQEESSYVDDGDVPTSSDEYEADPERDVDLDEGLEEIFDDIDTTEEGQVVLTSETLRRMNNQTDGSESEDSVDEPERSEGDIDDIEEALEEIDDERLDQDADEIDVDLDEMDEELDIDDPLEEEEFAEREVDLSEDIFSEENRQSKSSVEADENQPSGTESEGDD